MINRARAAIKLNIAADDVVTGLELHPSFDLCTRKSIIFELVWDPLILITLTAIKTS